MAELTKLVKFCDGLINDGYDFSPAMNAQMDDFGKLCVSFAYLDDLGVVKQLRRGTYTD